MNILDIAILAILLLFTLKGALRGLLKEVCSLVGLVAAAVIAFTFYAPLAERVSAWLNLPLQLCVVVILILLFVLTMVFFSLVGAILSRFVTLLFMGGLNRVLGALFSLMQGVLILALVLYGISNSALPRVVESTFAASKLRPPFVEFGGSLVRHSQKLFQQVT
ncbi:MAG: CvpA family protein [Desulfuromonadaceae bacterium]|nr:CvpA family protein [Desulfuromonadaceae bacterium]